MEVFVLLTPLVILFWMVGIHLDKSRISSYMGERGNVTVSIKLRLFGHGWLSESSKEGGGNRIYEVTYNDQYGALHHVWSKTTMFAGVYLAEDSIISPATRQGRDMTADEKVAFLEEKLRRALSGKG